MIIAADVHAHALRVGASNRAILRMHGRRNDHFGSLLFEVIEAHD